MVLVVYRSALFFVAIFLVNIQTSQCLLNGSLGRRPSSSSESNREEQSKTLKNNGRGHRQSSQSERTLSIHGLDRSTEKAQEAERQEGGNTVGRDRNNRNSRNLGSDTRRQSERGTASMQTSVNERNNHQGDRTTERDQVEGKTVGRQQTANVGERDRTVRNGRNRSGGSSKAISQSEREISSMQTSVNQRNNQQDDRTIEREQVEGNTVGRQQADNVGERDRNDRNGCNKGDGSSNTRSQSEEETRSMQTSVNQRNNQRGNRIPKREQVAGKTVGRQQADNVGERNRNDRNGRNKGDGSSNTRSQSEEETRSMQISASERNNQRGSGITEKEQVAGNTVGRQQADNVRQRDRNDRNGHNREGGSSNTRSQSGRGTTLMQTSERNNQRVDRTSQRDQVEAGQFKRNLNQRVANEERSIGRQANKRTQRLG
nr:GATA zinc finger domain-containing protein 14-like [Crassostrea gigas]